MRIRAVRSESYTICCLSAGAVALKPDGADAQADQELCCPRIIEDLFSEVSSNIVLLLRDDQGHCVVLPVAILSIVSKPFHRHGRHTSQPRSLI